MYVGELDLKAHCLALISGISYYGKTHTKYLSCVFDEPSPVPL